MVLNRLVEHGAVERECERNLAPRILGFHRRVELAEEAYLALLTEAQHVARLEPLRGSHEGAPARPVEPLMQRRLDLGVGPAPDPAAGEPRRYHTSVIDHERVAGTQEFGKVAHATIFKLR